VAIARFRAGSGREPCCAVQTISKTGSGRARSVLEGDGLGLRRKTKPSDLVAARGASGTRQGRVRHGVPQFQTCSAISPAWRISPGPCAGCKGLFAADARQGGAPMGSFWKTRGCFIAPSFDCAASAISRAVPQQRVGYCAGARTQSERAAGDGMRPTWEAASGNWVEERLA